MLNWTPVEIEGTKPGRRSHHTAVALKEKMIVFGGLGPVASSELWQLDTGKGAKKIHRHSME